MVYNPIKHGFLRRGIWNLVSSGSTLLDGLVSWWDLDETSGTRSDAVGTNHLTDVNTVLYESGKIGNAASFVAANSESLSSTSSSLKTANTSFSLSFWFYEDSAVNGGLVGNWTGGDRGFAINKLSLRIRFLLRYANNSSERLIQTGSSYSAGTWNHVVAYYDHAGQSMGLVWNNGSPVTDSHTDGSRASSNPFEIGGVLGVAYNTGRVDMAGFWSRVLTSDEITELYNLGAGIKNDFTDNGEGFRQNLVAYYKMEEESGTRVNTVNPGTYDLTDNNTVGYAAGKNGNAASFGTSESESLSVDPGPMPTSLSVSCWVDAQPLELGEEYGAVVRLKDGLWALTLGWSNTNPAPPGGTFLAVSEYSSAWYDTYATKSWTAPKLSSGFHHIVALTDDVTNEMAVYLDGVLWVGSISYTNPWGTGVAATKCIIGPEGAVHERIPSTTNWDPIIDEVKIYSRILSPDEIAALYASGAGRFYDFNTL